MKRALQIASIVLASAIPLAAQSPLTRYQIPGGTRLHIEMTTTITTKVNEVGDFFSGQVMDPIFADHAEVVPMGSIVKGHITMLRPPGRHVKAEIRLAIDSIRTPSGVLYRLTAGLHGVEGGTKTKMVGKEGVAQGSGKSKKKTAEQTGIGAAAGAGVGAIAAGGAGALYGAGIGATALFIRRLLKKNRNIVLVQGSRLIFEVPRTVTATRVSAQTNSN